MIVVLEEARPRLEHGERRGQELRLDQAELGHQQPGGDHGDEGGDADPDLDIGPGARPEAEEVAPGTGLARRRGRRCGTADGPLRSGGRDAVPNGHTCAHAAVLG
jgi:hypothetical protein